MARRPSKRGLAVLDGEAGCTVAVLCLAATWADEFPGGWVDYDDFAEYGVAFGGRGRNRKGLRSCIRRGLRTFRKRVGPLAVDRRRVPAEKWYKRECEKTLSQKVAESSGGEGPSGPSRERERRIRPPVPRGLLKWFFTRGIRFIAPEKSREFQMSASPIPRNLEESGTCLRQLTAELWRSWEDRDDAAEELESLVEDGPDGRLSTSLSLAYARLLVRTGGADGFAEAGRLLAELSRTAKRYGTLEESLLSARVDIECCYYTALEQLAWNDRAGSFATAMSACEAYAAAPQALEAGLPPGDRAKLRTVLSLVELSKAAQEDVERRGGILEDAGQLVVSALQNARAAGDAGTFADAMAMRAEHAFMSRILEPPGPTEVIIDAVEDVFLDFWYVLKRLGGAQGPPPLFLARSSELKAIRAVLRAQRGQKTAVQRLVDESAYMIALLENRADAPWERRLLKHSRARAARHWEEAGCEPSGGHYTIQARYRADSPEDGDESARIVEVQCGTPLRPHKRPKEHRRVANRGRQPGRTRSAKRQYDDKRRKR